MLKRCRSKNNTNKELFSIIIRLPESGCQGSKAADMGGTVSGDAPQLDSTRTPCMEAVEGSTVLRAAFSGAIRLNCTLERQPTNPGVLYRSINTGSIWPVSERQQQKTAAFLCMWREKSCSVLYYPQLFFQYYYTSQPNIQLQKEKNIPPEVFISTQSKNNVITMQINKKNIC